LKGKLYIISVVSVWTLSILACSLIGGNESSEIPPEVLFKDNFSDNNSGWDQLNDESIITDYNNGIYHIYINMDNTDVWANPGLDFSDSVIEVNAAKKGGPDDNDFGVICRYQGPDDFYFFIVSSDGYYAIGKWSGGDQVLISSENMEYSDVINQGYATNKLRAECISSSLVLWANDQVLAEVTDTDFKTGDVGLIAGTFNVPGTDIEFDDFVVNKP